MREGISEGEEEEFVEEVIKDTIYLNDNNNRTFL